MKINKYLPIAILYFFFNAMALPFGLTYTALLCPFLYWWVSIEKKRDVLLPFLVALAPFIVVQFINHVDSRAYLLSLVNYTAVYIFCHAFFCFLKVSNSTEKIFRMLLGINFLFCLIAIAIYFTPYNPLLWMEHGLTDGDEHLHRLKLFTYEPSYYAILFTPLFFFFVLQIILRQNKINSWVLLTMVLLPLFLSFSIGVISAVLFASLATYFVFFKRLTRKKRVLNLLLFTGITIAAAGFVLILFFPQNVFFVRLHFILSGRDTSGNGRTLDAFILARQILELKSSAWGVGPGQIKILGGDIIRDYYLYPLDYTGIAIPNAAAETLAIFGWAGFVLRTGIELFLFFYTRVWTNYYRLLLFLFVFLYQFTGSFITNVAEYVIWILAFTNSFPRFNVLQPLPVVRDRLAIQALC